MDRSLEQLCESLYSHNKEQNLVSRRLDRDSLMGLLVESASLAELPPFKTLTSGKQVVDLGSGGGLLGLPLALVREDLDFLLVEGTSKKCQATRQIVEEMALKNVKVLHERVERVRAPAPDMFVARFFMDPRGVAIHTKRWRKPGTQYLLFAGAETSTQETIYNLLLRERFSVSEDKSVLHYVTQ